MEHELAKKIAESAALQGHIPQEKIPIYQYGFELLISSVCSVLFILAIGIVFGHPGHALIYLAGFIPIRVCAGGYHGKTHLECYIVFSIAFALCIWLSLSLTFAQVFPIITGFALLLAMVCFAPVEAKISRLLQSAAKGIGEAQLSFQQLICLLRSCCLACNFNLEHFPRSTI